MLLVAEPGLLLLLAANDTAASLRALLDFADPMVEFRTVERRWRWSAALACQLESVLDALVHRREDAPSTGSAFLFLHGGFELRHFPVAARTWAGSPPGAAAADPGTLRIANRNMPGIRQIFGAASAQNTSFDLSPDGDCYYKSCHRTGIVGVGRGASEPQMRDGAIFEYIERWAATSRPPGTVTASRRQLGEVALAPDALWGISTRAAKDAFPAFHDDLRIEWAPCVMQRERCARLIPAEFVSYLAKPMAAIAPQRNSSGCAVGNAADEAALYAALEIVERDALLLCWYARRAPPRLRLDSIGCPRCQDLVRVLAAQGYDVACFDMTTEIGISAVLVLLRGRGRARLAGFVTSSAHVHPAQALYGALAEAKSLLATAERNYARSGFAGRGAESAEILLRSHEDQYLYYGDPARVSAFDFLSDERETLDHAEFLARNGCGAKNAVEGFEVLCGRVGAAGYDMVVCDTTPACLQGLGLASARVYVPGTINLVFGARPSSIPEDRFSRASGRLPWLRGTTAPAEPVLPHPLG